MTKENTRGSSSSPSKQQTGQREKELTAMIMDMEAKHGEFLEYLSGFIHVYACRMHSVQCKYFIVDIRVAVPAEILRYLNVQILHDIWTFAAVLFPLPPPPPPPPPHNIKNYI